MNKILGSEDPKDDPLNFEKGDQGDADNLFKLMDQIKFARENN